MSVSRRQAPGSPRAGTEGFTLVEVLAGIVIVAIALGGLYALYHTLVLAEAHRRQLVEATAAVTSAIEQAKALPWEQMPAAFTGGRCPPGSPAAEGLALRCSLETDPPGLDPLGAGLVRITASATDPRTGSTIADITVLRAREGF